MNARANFPGFLVALITSVIGISVPLEARENPRIVLGIIIDGLDSQYLDLLKDNFTDGGFKRLIDEGVVFESIDYGANLDATASIATLLTGASPSVTSVDAAQYYDRDAMRVENTLFERGLSSFDILSYSPQGLSVSTISDEARIASGGISRAYGISPDPAQAVILAGHSANSALWLNKKNGQWVTSPFYKETPTGIAYRNRLRPLSLRLDTIQWTPLMPVSAYSAVPAHLTHYPFRYTFPAGNPSRYDIFQASPLINTEITDLTCELIDDLSPDALQGTNVINISLNLKPFDFTRNSDNRYELIDSYLRLDRDLKRLFDKAEEKAGDGDALFFVAATPPPALARKDDERWMIPYGEFSTKKAKSLLNMFLIAKYGNGDWISAFFNNRFYLNHKLINDRNIDPRILRADAADFLEKMSGINQVYTLDEILENKGDSKLDAIRRNTALATAGDLFIEVAPGWETLDDINNHVDDSRVSYIHRYASPSAPLYILSRNLSARTVSTPVDVRVVAPTIARVLRIRAPNAASFPPVAL